jgi:hypothetical protein
MKKLQSLENFKKLNSLELVKINGGDLDGSASQFTSVKSTCENDYNDETGLSRTDIHVGGAGGGGYWVFGPWNRYKKTLSTCCN